MSLSRWVEAEFNHALRLAPSATLLVTAEKTLEWDPARGDGRVATGVTARVVDGAGPATPVPAFDDPVADLSVRTLAERVARRVTELGPLQALLVRAVTTWTVGGTASQSLSESETRTELFVRIETPRGALLESWGSPPVRELDPDQVAQQLLERLQRSAAALGDAAAVAADPRLPWRLAPPVAAPLLGALSSLLRADVAISSGLSKNLSKRLFPAALTVVDDPQLDGATRRRTHDDEGTPCEGIVLVEGGKLATLLHTRASAEELRVPANGRGFFGEGSRTLPSAINLHVRPGSGVAPSDFVDLTTRIETFTTSPRLGHVSIVVAGREHRGGEPGALLRPFALELPVLATLRRVIATGSELTFYPAFEGAGTPALYLEPIKAA